MLRELIDKSETLDKLGVAEELLRLLAKEHHTGIQDFDKLKEQLKKNLKDLCFPLRSLLEESTRTARKSSGKQAIHRLIHEFRAVQRRGCSMVNLQRLVDRIVSELETLGDDGDTARAQLHEWKDNLEKLFRSGITHLTDEKWASWSARLEQLSRDPFNPQVIS